MRGTDREWVAVPGLGGRALRTCDLVGTVSVLGVEKFWKESVVIVTQLVDAVNASELHITIANMVRFMLHVIYPSTKITGRGGGGRAGEGPQAGRASCRCHMRTGTRGCACRPGLRAGRQNHTQVDAG